MEIEKNKEKKKSQSKNKVTVYFSEEELKKLKREAEKKYLPVSIFLRQLILEKLDEKNTK